MKKTNILTIVIFFSLIIIPLFGFTFEEGIASEIDNRFLAENPFSADFVSETNDLTADIESYIDDRIGYRDGMINLYTILNDKLFGEMVHPSYTYGKDGYVFGQLASNVEFGEYHLEFANMIKKIQDYCEERDVPFLFVFDPSKASVMTDKLGVGINYNSDWVTEFFEILDELGINYVDNTTVLTEKYQEGEAVFNKKYNAGHWNDLGAFYGVNAILSNLQTYFPSLQLNELSDFEIEQTLNSTLLVSKFPINEYEPIFYGYQQVIDLTGEYDAEVIRNESYQGFMYRINEAAKEKGTPKTLVFQGSYMNGMGYKFFQNAFGEYIAVHDYQNIINFDYYFNIFQPECVIFEVAEYTFKDQYFSFEGMKNMELNPNVKSFDRISERQISMSDLDINVETGDVLSIVSVDGLQENTKYAYIKIGDTYFDLIKQDNGEYAATVENTSIEGDDMAVIAVNDTLSQKTIYIKS